MKLEYPFFTFLLLTTPWLNPFAPGPSPSVVPWLYSVACWAGALFIFAHCLRSQRYAGTELQISTGSELAAAFGASWLAAGLISCLLGLAQYFDLAAFFAPWVNATQPGEAFANLRQRNQFATLTNIALAALLYFTVRSQHTPAAARQGRAALLFAGAGLLAIGNAISSSRTGLFQLLLLCLVYTLWGGLRVATVRPLLFNALLVYAVAMFAAPWLAGLDASSYGAFARLGKDEACSSRLVLWSNVLHLIAQKPWLGWGWGELDYAHFITLYNEPRFCDILDNAHNLPLQLAVELGVPLSALVCGGFAWWALRQKPWAERDASRQMAWAVISVILLHSLLEYPLWYGPFQIAFGLCVVILWRWPAAESVGTTNANDVLIKPLAQYKQGLAATLTIATAIGLTACAYAAWDYRRVSQIYLQPEARDAAYQSDTLGHARKSLLFADQALFAELLLTPLTPATAAWVHASASRLLHYSPEPRVVEKLIESAVMLGKDDDALAHLARFKAAFPEEYAVWTKSNLKPIRY
jgi:O-antigen ligase